MTVADELTPAEAPCRAVSPAIPDHTEALDTLVLAAHHALTVPCLVIEENSTVAKLAGLDHQRAAIDEVKASIAGINATLPLLQQRRQIREQGLRNEFGSRYAFLQDERELVDQQNQLLVDQHRLDEAVQAVATLDQQRGEAEAEYRKTLLSDLSDARARVTEKSNEAIKFSQLTALQTLTAPVSGTVEQLAVHTIGGVVTPAQTLMTLVPDGSRLEIEAMLPNKDVGFVHAGQDVAVKVEAFTFTRYGLLHGTVRTVSRDSASGDDARDRKAMDPEVPSDDQERQAHQPAYVAHVTLAETGVDTEQGWTSLEPGMAVVAEIKTGRRRVIDYLLSPLMRYAQEGGRER
jgi:hemolysin D